ncbi:chloroperoxidase [Colletotrichum karsti]|uniref:Chloroperoxidase n=1 Tax=Colletotrichum karsti TaxID=1095194 RepID=A0A9P6LGE2_9PEZI|nr:chloroperoxidase [Colletotrichum karsti]KAF9875114.1 chloroperoxidase [Colletotrichum karsti]
MPAIFADQFVSFLPAGNEQKTKLDVSVKDQDVTQRELPGIADCATHLRLLDTFVALRRSVELLADEANLTAEQGWDLYCKRAVSRFEKWSAAVERQQPPVDVLMAWHALMLHPKAYARFIELGGNLGLSGLDWIEVSNSVDADITLSRFLDFIEEDSTLESLVAEGRQSTGIFNLKNSAGTVLFSYNLSAAINRQFDFSSKMSRYAWLRSPTAEATIAQSIERYRNFFHLIGAHPGTVMVPTLDIDLVWHTHQLSPLRYRAYSKKMAGRLIDHDDEISADRLQELTTDMQSLWREEFGTEYHACLCWTCEAGRAHVNVEAVEDKLCVEESQRELLPLADLAFPRCTDCVMVAAACAATTSAYAVPRDEDPNFAWQAPDASAKRSPCPMLNSLANHGYLPRDGKSISMDNLISGLGKAINFNESLVRTLGTPAFATSTTGDANTFNLDDIAKHNVIEHDGSLSRADFAVTGDAKTFNETVWGETKGYLAEGAAATEDKINVATMATARSKRIATAKATNPSFNLTTSQVTVSLGESAVILGTLGGSFSSPAAPLEWMKIVFEEERLPFKEGFNTSSEPITTAEVLALSQLIATSSS